MYVHSKRIGYDVGTTQRVERERLIGLLRDEHQLRALDISRAFLFLVCRVYVEGWCTHRFVDLTLQINIEHLARVFRSLWLRTNLITVEQPATLPYSSYFSQPLVETVSSQSVIYRDRKTLGRRWKISRRR